MQYSTRCIEKEISANGIEFEKGSVYDRLGKLTDLRKAKGKRYSLDMLLMIIMMAKLCGENTPMEIAEWAQHRKGQLMEMLQLKWSRMPHHNTYRRVLAEKMYADEIERLVGEYNQSGDHGTVYAMDGKAMLGKRRDGETGTEYLLSVYDVEQAKVMSQVEVGRKENEITKASQALKQVEIAQKVVTGDAMHTQRGVSRQIIEAGGDYVWPVKENQLHLYQNIQSLFAPEYPKPGFGKIPTDFLTARTVNKGHGRIETRTITTSEMLNAYSGWPEVAQVYRLERHFDWRRNGRSIKTSYQVEFGITSLTRQKATPLTLLNVRRTHWGIETGLHYRRDVTLREDATRMTVGNAAKIMASLNNLVLALIRQANFQNAAQARRWFSCHIDKAFALLTTPSTRL
ncbi:MAG: ISAs1 family transposase [Chloroflexi bacterium]|nr:ISAs1 family transposase [Chloroflexota bacterium]